MSASAHKVIATTAKEFTAVYLRDFVVKLEGVVGRGSEVCWLLFGKY
jgi:hypothetical protein